MKRPVTICSGQFGDIPFEELCRTMHGLGYEGLELAAQSHIDVERIVSDPEYREHFQKTLEDNQLIISAISAHLMGQCVGDNWDPRLDNFAPARLAGKPEEIRAWAIEGMKTTARAAQLLGVKVVTCFLGSPIWPMWYSFPQTTPEMVDAGFARIKELWTPIFDVYDECGVRLALEVHPTEIAFDYYSTERLLKTLDYRPTLGLNFDPSHLLWQGVSPVLFLRRFREQIYHVHMKDVRINRDGLGGILGSHIEFGDTRRGWNFVSLGHGDVDFEGIIRELNQMGYHGPLCVEWEDSGMERMHGAKEALEFVRRMNFESSDVSFDAALKVD
ncbi:MAG: sugar phosphate isomerase/epimerase [Clostridiales bacterium]|nr:sugar phosphate isomerase/epimerase [Clostridiales bacterium]MDY5515948.1 sugar phosphate isomerase/epimerase family protein [Candidatus Ventricola sp.]